VGKKCPDCDAELIFKFGRFGKFIACSNYPNCKHKEQTDNEKNTEKVLKEKYE
jgi:DNA topoisomerase-1